MHKVRTIMSKPTPRTSPEILYIPIEDGTVPMVDLDDYRNLEIQLAAKSAECERLKAEINFAGALAKSLMPYQERAAQAEAREQALRVALDKCREFAEREKRKATFPKLDDPDYDDPWIWDCDAIIAVIDAARQK
jgi:hypothetical protein